MKSIINFMDDKVKEAIGDYKVFKVIKVFKAINDDGRTNRIKS